MVKGCQRRMICLYDTGSEWFEEAHFLLRESKEGQQCDEESLLKEAHRIANGQGRGMKKETPRSLAVLGRLFYMSLGATLAFLLCAVLTAVF